MTHRNPTLPARAIRTATDGAVRARSLRPLWFTAVLASAVASTPTFAQAAPKQPKPVSAVRTLVFTDTASFRTEITVRGGASLNGHALRGALIRESDASVAWSGSLGTLSTSGADAVSRTRIASLRVTRWRPSAPAMYRLIVESADAVDAISDSVRIGFRTMAAANGRILLNGAPLFLRGNAINPPGRNVPDSLNESPRFAREYLRYLKSVGVNIVRLGSVSSVWLDAADDVGMLVFQGSYGVPKGGTTNRAPASIATSLAWYRDDVLATQVNHPSVVIYTLANEVADAEVHYQSAGAAAMGRFLQTMYDSLHVWDPTRLVIANAGYGFGRTGDVCDMHRYWGWYYNSFLSFYTLRDPNVCWRGRTGQPITMSENTGNYTGGDGRFNLVSDTKQPDSQLNWTGHAPDAEQGPRALAYQAWMAGQAIEITRRLRERNPNLAGLSPFSIVFSQWFGITSFADMKPKPVLAQYARSFQPVLLSWESWTPHVYAGTTLSPVAHVVNDDDGGAALRGATLHVALRDASGRAVASRSMPWPDLAYYGANSRDVAITVPSTAAAGSYTLDGALLRGRDTLSRNSTTIRVFARECTQECARGPESLGRRLRIYDPSRRTQRALAALGVSTVAVTRVVTLDPARDALIVGSEAWDAALTGQIGTIEQFVSRGGRALVLDQRPERFASHWLPGGVRLSIGALDHADVFPGGRPWAQGMSINPERPTHAVFAGLTRDDFFLWSDYTGWRESTPGFPAVYPVTRGFALTRPQDLGRVAVLANYDHGLLGVALAEFFTGTGSTLLSGFDLVPRVGKDPVADRVLRNLVAYVGGSASHDVHPLIASKITWGDYASERGLLTGVHSGFLLNTVPTMPAELQARYPIKIDEDGFWTAGDAGGWNTRPAVQYVPRGRRPFGPYEFTSGGAYRLPDEHGPDGEGRVWMRIPTGRVAMLNSLQNPSSDSLDVTVTVNGASQRRRLAPGETLRIESPLAATVTTVSLTVRGDRRLILLESDFR